MARIVLSLVSIAAAVLVAASPARAQVTAELDDCARGAVAAQRYGTYDLAIHFCSRLIRNGRIPPEILEWALTQRGTAYQGKGIATRTGADADPELARALAARARTDLVAAQQMAVVRQMTETEQRAAALAQATEEAARAVLRATGARADADTLARQAGLLATQYQAAAEENPTTAAGYLYRGIVRATRREFDTAEQDITEALRLDPGMALTHYNRGVLYLLLAHNDQALADFDAAAQLAPDLAQTYYNRGIAYARAGDMVQAVLDFTEAIAINPAYVEAFNNRGFAFEVMGERERAEADFITAWRLQPDNPRFRRKLLDLGLGNVVQP